MVQIRFQLEAMWDNLLRDCYNRNHVKGPGVSKAVQASEAYITEEDMAQNSAAKSFL